MPRLSCSRHLDGHRKDCPDCRKRWEGYHGKPCALCPSPADPNGFYPDLCPTCTEVEYGNELTGDV